MSDWIKVKDRVPELSEHNFPSKNVFVFDAAHKQVRIGYYHQGKMHISCDHCSENSKITHWKEIQIPTDEQLK